MQKTNLFDRTDDPIKKPNEDLLNLDEYVNGICALINQTFKERKNACIGIVGKWGDGKTSAINLCIDKLKKEYNIRKNLNFAAIIICLCFIYVLMSFLNFNLAAIIEKLVFIYISIISFFGTRLNLILVSVLILLCLYKQLVSLTYKYYKFLKKFFSSLFLKNQYIVIKFSPWDCSNKNQIFKEYLKSLAKDLFLVSPAISNLLLTYSKEITGLNLAPLAKVMNPYSNIATLKQEITNNLGYSDKRIIVIIDDFDRIHCKEIFNMLKLVGSIANFPNIVNIVAYDKDYISEELQDCFSDKEKEKHKDKINRYLQKIIQDELPLPKISHEKIFDIFMPKLDEIISDFEYNKQALISNYKNTIGGYLTNLRNTKKLLNAFEFHYKIFRNNNININIIDLLFLTAIKTFNFELWQKVYNIGKGAFVSNLGGSAYILEYSMRDEDLAEFYEKNLGISLLSVHEQNILWSLMSNVLKSNIKHIYCIEDKEEFDIKRFMSSLETYNLYFEFNPPKSNLKDIIKLLKSEHFDRLSLQETLKDSLDFSDLKDFLNAKQYRGQINEIVILNLIELLLFSPVIHTELGLWFTMNIFSNDNEYMQEINPETIGDKIYSIISNSSNIINFDAISEIIDGWLLHKSGATSREDIRETNENEAGILNKLLPILKDKFLQADIFDLSINTIYTFYYTFNKVHSEYRKLLQDKIYEECKTRENEDLLELFIHFMSINYDDKRSLNILDEDVFTKEAKEIIKEKLIKMKKNVSIMNDTSFEFVYFDTKRFTNTETWSKKPYHLVNFILDWGLKDKTEVGLNDEIEAESLIVENIPDINDVEN